MCLCICEHAYIFVEFVCHVAHRLDEKKRKNYAHRPHLMCVSTPSSIRVYICAYAHTYTYIHLSSSCAEHLSAATPSQTQTCVARTANFQLRSSFRKKILFHITSHTPQRQPNHQPTWPSQSHSDCSIVHKRAFFHLQKSPPTVCAKETYPTLLAGVC